MLPAVGAELGPYRLRRQLAAGGMGAVFEAETEGGENVAIKFLHPELARDEEMNLRFHREANILRSLDHPSIVRVRDMGAGRFGAFTVMELLRGETLEARLARGPMSLREFVGVLTPIADALDAAHEHGVIHGDLKPANIFLQEGGRAVLVDFGTSKVLGLERLTRTGEVCGTPIYMAPELLTGEGAIDARIDTYALGVLAYRALSGTIPFTERNPGRLLFQIVMGEVSPIDGEVPRGAVHVIAQAMCKEREGRFVRASALARAFAGILEEGE